MIGQAPVGEEGESASRTSLVFRHRYVRLEHALTVDIAFHVFRSSSVFTKDAKLRPFVFHGGEVGVQYVGGAYSVEGGAGDGAVLLGVGADGAETEKE